MRKCCFVEVCSRYCQSLCVESRGEMILPQLSECQERAWQTADELLIDEAGVEDEVVSDNWLFGLREKLYDSRETHLFVKDVISLHLLIS